MSTNESSLSTPTSESLPHVQHTESIMDSEMTCPLIPNGDRSTKSRSSSPKKVEMSSWSSSQGGGNNRNGNRRMSFNHQQAGGRRSPQNWGYDAAPITEQHIEYNPHTPSIQGGYGGHGAGDMALTGENSVPLSSVVPGAVWPTDNQLATAYAYAVRREDGSITRYVAADDLASGNVNPNMPPYQGPEGLIILPMPRQVSPSRRQGPEIMVPSHVVMSLNAPRRYPEVDQTQMAIDQIVQSHGITSPPRRREKIYCDKWIHEGVCAFTQMGCKYKHEMPTDKATQISLGLNHGLPAWYRRAYSVNIKSPVAQPAVMVATTTPTNVRRLDSNWRHSDGAPAYNGEMTIGNSRNNFRGSGNGLRTGFGPIGPPPAQPNFFQSSYSTLKLEEDNEEEDDDTVTYRGRQERQ